MNTRRPVGFMGESPQAPGMKPTPINTIEPKAPMLDEGGAPNRPNFVQSLRNPSLGSGRPPFKQFNGKGGISKRI